MVALHERMLFFQCSYYLVLLPLYRVLLSFHNNHDVVEDMDDRSIVTCWLMTVRCTLNQNAEVQVRNAVDLLEYNWRNGRLHSNFAVSTVMQFSN